MQLDIWYLTCLYETNGKAKKSHKQKNHFFFFFFFSKKNKEMLAQSCFLVHFSCETELNQDGTVNFSAASVFIMGQQNSLFCLFKCKPIKSKANTQLLKSYSLESDRAGGKTLTQLSLCPSSLVHVHSNSRRLPRRRTKPCCSSKMCTIPVSWRWFMTVTDWIRAVPAAVTVQMRLNSKFYFSFVAWNLDPEAGGFGIHFYQEVTSDS